MVVLGVYIYGTSLISYRNSYGKVPKNKWVQVDPPCAETGVKSSLGTLVLNSLCFGSYSRKYTFFGYTYIYIFTFIIFIFIFVYFLMYFHNSLIPSVTFLFLP